MIIFRMEKQVEKEDWVTQTDFVLIDCYQQQEETFLPSLDDGTIDSYECEDRRILQFIFQMGKGWWKINL